MRIVVVFLAAAGVALWARPRLDGVELPAPPTLEEALPSERSLHFLSLGYKTLVADYYWLRAISNFGDRAMAEAHHPNLIALTRRVLSLDPYFATAYFFAGTALTIKDLDPRPSIELLEQGLRYRPDDWRIAYLLGFNAYYFMHDVVRGAEALAAAARHPEAPPITGALSSRLAAEGGVPEIGIELIDSLLDSITDPEIREGYMERRRLLELELVLERLNDAAGRFTVAKGRPPRALGDLLAAGLLAEVPVEPLGGAFYVDEEGRVCTSNEERRLRLPESAKGPTL